MRNNTSSISKDGKLARARLFQSPIFSRDRLDIPRLTVTGFLIFKIYRGGGRRGL